MERPRELPRPPVMQGNAVRSAMREQREHKARSALKMLANFVGGGFFGSVIDNFFGAGGNEKKYGAGYRRSTAPSRRDSAAIVGDLRAFYRQRPRPWRWPGNAVRHRSRRRPGWRTWLRA